MDGKTECMKRIRQMFLSVEPNGRGKIHKDTLREILKKGYNDSYDDESIDTTISKMKPDSKGMITPEGYFLPFSMAENSPEEVAAARNIFENYPQLFDNSVDLHKMAESIGFDKPAEVEKLMMMIRRCYLDSLGARLQQDPPKSEELVKRKQAQLLRACYEDMCDK